MEFMLLFVDRTRSPGEKPAGEPAGMGALGKFVSELVRQGKFRRGAPLRPLSDGARIRVRDGNAVVTDGPLVESNEVLGGFWMIEVNSRDEAIEIARRAFETGEPRPEARHGLIEVHGVNWRETADDPGRGVPFLFAFRREPGLADPDGSKLKEMIAFGRALHEEHKFVETAPLVTDPPPVRIEARGGKTLVIDGPFAESKEAVGGYSLIRAANRAEAIEIAKRYPHARWGPVEVREMILPV